MFEKGLLVIRTTPRIKGNDLLMNGHNCVWDKYLFITNRTKLSHKNLNRARARGVYLPARRICSPYHVPTRVMICHVIKIGLQNFLNCLRGDTFGLYNDRVYRLTTYKFVTNWYSKLYFRCINLKVRESCLKKKLPCTNCLHNVRRVGDNEEGWTPLLLPLPRVECRGKVEEGRGSLKGGFDLTFTPTVALLFSYPLSHFPLSYTLKSSFILAFSNLPK